MWWTKTNEPVQCPKWWEGKSVQKNWLTTETLPLLLLGIDYYYYNNNNYYYYIIIILLLLLLLLLLGLGKMPVRCTGREKCVHFY
jgi:hypothetical protein